MSGLLVVSTCLQYRPFDHVQYEQALVHRNKWNVICLTA